MCCSHDPSRTIPIKLNKHLITTAIIIIVTTIIGIFIVVVIQLH